MRDILVKTTEADEKNRQEIGYSSITLTHNQEGLPITLNIQKFRRSAYRNDESITLHQYGQEKETNTRTGTEQNKYSVSGYCDREK